ncbi:MAG TPA: hypothetical protein VFT55_06510 [Planctomycetota bacterium]|nr:hypothetical protein [Planctomycetota bacterium]
MTRRTIPLQQNLLTRSDLARLEILAAQLRHWQATGWLEQIGRLPDAESHGDAVFAVHSPDLRKELASRLETLGKSAVVMSPQQARSLLLQDQSEAETETGPPGAERDDAATRGCDTADEPSAASPVETGWDTDNALATHLLENDLPQVLQEAAAELESEVEGEMAMADSEAQGRGDSIDAGAPHTFEQPFEAGELDVDDLHAALANWDPCEQDATMNELAVPTRRAAACAPPAPKTSPAFDRRSETMVPVVPAATRATDPAASAVSRVETCLGELKSAMAAMTREPAAVDLRPIIEAVQAGFDGASRQSAALSSTVLSLTEQLSRIAPQDERDATRPVADARRGSAAARSHIAPPQFVPARDDRQPMALLAIAVLVLCWCLLLWLKTSSPSVALGTIVGAIAVACCLSGARRART